MAHEDKHDPTIHDAIREMMAVAKHDLQTSETGLVAPALVVYGAKGHLLVPLPEFPFPGYPANSEGRRQTMYLLGRTLAGVQPDRVLFQSDTYLRVPKRNPDGSFENPYDKVDSLADDPKSTDALMVASLDTQKRSCLLLLSYECIARLDGPPDIKFEPELMACDAPDFEKNAAYVLQPFFRGVMASQRRAEQPRARNV